jgi:type IV secretory pathway VirJ component
VSSRAHSPRIAAACWVSAALLCCVALVPARAADELPLILEAPKSAGTGLAVLVSGDGGWAAIDVGVSEALLSAGYGVVGLDASRYFKAKRTPTEFAADLESISRQYSTAWQRQELLLIGYSRGADLLPFAVTRLDKSLGDRLQAVVLLGPATFSSFTFHFADLWSNQRRSDTIETLPEAQRISHRIICVYGSEEADSLCPQLPHDPRYTSVELPGGHHFDGDYRGLGNRVLELLDAARAQPAAPSNPGS